jgi:hypothetical protein
LFRAVAKEMWVFPSVYLSREIVVCDLPCALSLVLGVALLVAKVGSDDSVVVYLRTKVQIAHGIGSYHVIGGINYISYRRLSFSPKSKISRWLCFRKTGFE